MEKANDRNIDLKKIEQFAIIAENIFNNNIYLVDITQSLNKAKEIALEHELDRGGKIKCEIFIAEINLKKIE